MVTGSSICCTHGFVRKCNDFSFVCFITTHTWNLYSCVNMVSQLPLGMSFVFWTCSLFFSFQFIACGMFFLTFRSSANVSQGNIISNVIAGRYMPKALSILVCGLVDDWILLWILQWSECWQGNNLMKH